MSEPYRWKGGDIIGSGRQSAFTTFGTEAAWLAGLTGWMVLGAVAIALALAALMVAASRSREGALTHRQGMRLVLWAGGIVPSVVLLALLIATLPAMRPIRAARDDLRVTVTGEQFWWRMAYRPAGAAAVTSANELRLPVGRDVVLALEGGDVLHSFWVPGLAGKMDMVPGRTNTLVVHATRAGRFRGQCAEFCGLSHALMAFDVVAMEPAAFDAWLAAERRPVTTAASTGARLFDAHGCGGCHAVRGTGAAGAIGPDLTHLGARASMAAGIQPLTTANLVRFIRDAPAVKPGARMPAYPQMSAADATAIARWLETNR
ncbi:cytochrome c oxidase subunit II [Sphingomonas sp. BK235]|uniref:cytochrome c oxidase subunit II n=1 Tax=Sphingomonas sp. BK235 TaxID=2512131 RepID=UPI0010F0285E|nr:cytochrome c oxidase subunit II [Sphingomonas sp. BK235]TCP34622.1 cytochrome c oxidase subunit 2 [Sphingomonas sp. BK235]